MDINYSDRFHNHGFFPILQNVMVRVIYILEIIQFTFQITVGSNITGINDCLSNCMVSHRVSSILAVNLQGGGVINQIDSHYGVRFGSSNQDGSSNMDRCHGYMVFYKEGGQY